MSRLSKLRRYRLEFVNFIAGAAVLTFELSAARIAAPYIGTSIYIWTSIIGVILAALAVGYSLGGKLADRRKKPEDVALLLSLAAAMITLVNLLKDPLLNVITGNSLPLQWQALFASLALFALPTVVLGMVSPYLARLNIKSLATSGQRVASVNAWGTAGSLFGTFLTGYVLFGFLGTRHILGAVALSLLAVSFLMSKSAYFVHRILLAAAVALSFILSPALFLPGVVSDTDTRYSRVIIKDAYLAGRPIRILQVDREYWQSGIYTDGDSGLVFTYAQTFDAVSRLKPGAEDYLVIGGGAFTFPSHLAGSNPQAAVDVVEIDGGLVGLSREYFNFRAPENLKIIIADGRQFLNNNFKRYDIIYMDAFSSVEPPFQLFTQEAAALVKQSLWPSGLAVVNVISATEGPDSKMIKAVAATYGAEFKYVEIFRAANGYKPESRQNLILLASSQPILPLLEGGTAGAELRQKRLAGAGVAGRVLTDDFAPVERLASSGL